MAFPRIEGYVVTEKLGSGSYSTVYKAYNKVGGRQTVAIKCVDKSRVKHSGAAVDNLVTEIRLLKTLVHPHIVRMHHFTWDDKNIYIVMEYCSGGDLSRYIKRYGRVPETQVRYFLQQLAAALRYLHEKGVLHMDLKPHNLLLHEAADRRLTLKVADFGFAQLLQAREGGGGGVRGSPLYMAPEMLAGTGGATVDLWSVGVIMYECLFGAAPYSSGTLRELLDKLHRHQEIKIPANAAISPECGDLLRSLLQHEPARRISYEDFFNHEYLDLEHMPSPENYDKAVALLRLAVSEDARGAAARALPAYTQGLRLLVPRVACERDAVRRQALRDKLTSYMERAEELKLFLSGQAAPAQGPSHIQLNENSDRSETSDTRRGETSDPLRGETSDPTRGETSDTKRDEDSGREILQDTRDELPPSLPPGLPPAPRRFALRRLFGRQNSLPPLDNKDSMADANSEEACRIS